LNPCATLRTIPPRTPRPKKQPASTSPIDRPITVGEGQQTKQTTVGARIVELVGSVGAQPERAALSVGVTAQQWADWCTSATAAMTTPASKQSAHTKACARLAQQVAEAEARWEMTALAALERAAHGYATEVTTEKYNATGDVTERRTRTIRQPPQSSVMMWKLARTMPERFAAAARAAVGADLADFTALFLAGDDPPAAALEEPLEP